MQLSSIILSLAAATIVAANPAAQEGDVSRETTNTNTDTDATKQLGAPFKLKDCKDTFEGSFILRAPLTVKELPKSASCEDVTAVYTLRNGQLRHVSQGVAYVNEAGRFTHGALEQQTNINDIPARALRAGFTVCKSQTFAIGNQINEAYICEGTLQVERVNAECTTVGLYMIPCTDGGASTQTGTGSTTGADEKTQVKVGTDPNANAVLNT